MRVHKKIGTKERLLEMFQNVNKIKLTEGDTMWGEEVKNESFDSPIKKDKKYLDKTVGDQSSQVSKYDDGTRYPVEDKLKVKDPSLEKLKGDDAPIVEAFGDEDDQDVADENGAEEKPAWDENFGGDEEEPAETEETEAEVEDPEMAIDNIPAGDGEEAPELDNEIEDGGIDQMTNTDEEPHEDQIEGGLADNASATDFCPIQISKGIKVEMEHTDDPHKALEIAMDHLTEIPDYYDRLETMEAEAKGEGQGSMEDDVEAPEDALLDPSKHWVDDYAPQNVSMGDEEIVEDYPLEGGDPEAGEEEFEFGEKAKSGEFEEETLDEDTDSIHGVDINGVPLNKYKNYVNQELTDASKESYKEGTDVWVFDLPKTEFDQNWFNSIEQFMGNEDGGVEGNPGGWVNKVSKGIEDVGEFYRLTVMISSVMDV
jgi:hypothetical protein